MRRFRFTLIAVCLVLLFLGGHDLLMWLNNPAPRQTTVTSLQDSGAPQDWLTVTGGRLDLDRAISTSGTIELEALLVPLLADPGQETIHILIETRDPALLGLFRDYHFHTDTLPEKRAFRERHAAEFTRQRDITGMRVAGLIARGNHQKLLELAGQTGLDVSADVLFLSEGKEPPRWRGVFYAVVGLLGLARVLRRKKPALPA